MKVSKTRQAKIDREEAIAYLRTLLKPGDKVWTKVDHVSSSGMTRHISCYVPDNDPKYGLGIQDITWWVGRAVGYRRSDKTGGLVVGGCGMDMCFAVVYTLGRVLFPEGFHTKLTPRDTAEALATGILTRDSHGVFACEKCYTNLSDDFRECEGADFHRNGDYSGWDNDGGYALHKENL